MKVSPSRSGIALVTCAMACQLSPPSACAEAAPEALAQPTLEVSGCEPELVRAVDAALAVELSMAGPETREALADGSLRCLLSCDASGAVAAVAHGSERLEQRVPRDEAGLSRRLAVALAELLSAASADQVEPPPPPPVERPLEPATAGLAVRLRVAGGVWFGGEPGLVLGGPELGVEVAPLPEVALVAGVSAAFGMLEVDAGRIDVRLLSGAASIRFGADLDAIHLGVGPAARGGAVLWSGHARDRSGGVGRDVLGGWLGVGLVAAVHLRLPELPLGFGLEVEGGGIAYSSSALAGGVLAASVSGGWIEARIVIDLTLR